MEFLHPPPNNFLRATPKWNFNNAIIYFRVIATCHSPPPVNLTIFPLLQSAGDRELLLRSHKLLMGPFSWGERDVNIAGMNTCHGSLTYLCRILMSSCPTWVNFHLSSWWLSVDVYALFYDFDLSTKLWAPQGACIPLSGIQSIWRFGGRPGTNYQQENIFLYKEAGL